ncbi:SWIM zinc finger domain-containing protein [Levilactobacillus cerevisiae]|uniref:SWIM zinc finger family protein n=1 Tax=Levilactobacillus cerevisiae TaxID=1704076 RepID=UPI00345E99A2
MDWETLFQSQILNRGYDYYQRGLVSQFKQTPTRITGVVTGSTTYQVSIEISGGRFVQGDCTCPYAAEGKYCKHMAAVLFTWESAADDTDQPTGKATSTVSTLVANASDQQVRDFLTRVLTADGRLAQQFKTMVSPAASKEALLEYRLLITSLFQSHMDRSGFIDYRAARAFGNDVADFMQGDVQQMIIDQRLGLAFDVVAVVAERVTNLDIDDSDGETMIIVQECVDAWEQIVQQADLTLRRQMFQWFQQHVEGSLEPFDEAIIDFIFQNFTEPEFLQAKLTLSDQQLKKNQATPDGWNHDYTGGVWTMHRLEVMSQLKVAPQEINDFCQANLQFDDVRQFAVDQSVAQKDYPAAVQLLLGGKQRGEAQRLRGVTLKFSRQLKDVYRASGQSAAYDRELWELLTVTDAADLTLYQELKEQTTAAKWPAERTRLFAAMPASADLKPLYAEDHLYSDLLAAVVAEDDLQGVMTYEDQLKPKYDDALLAKYVQVAQARVKSTGTRSQYRQLVRLLNHMLTYPSGYAAANKLVQEWRATYPRRTAMLDELKGFNAGPR